MQRQTESRARTTMANRGSKGQSVWRRAAIALEEEPERRWLSFVVHHGARVLLLLLTALGVYLLFPAPRAPDATVFERGVVAPQDVIAEVAFDIPKIPAELLREQTEAASGVPPVYVLEPAASDSVLLGIGGLFASIDSILVDVPPAEHGASIRNFMERNRLSPTTNSVNLILDPQRRTTLQRSIERAVRELYPLGVAPSSLSQGVSTIRVAMPSGAERLVPRDSLVMPDRFYSLAAERLRGQGADALELQRLIMIRFFEPSLIYDAERTEATRERARAAVDPVRTRVLQGERIVGAHEQIGEAEEERLRAYQAELTRLGRGMDGEESGTGRAIGAVLFNALVLGILGALVFFFRRSLYRDLRGLIVLTALTLTVATTASLIARFSLPVELIPVTFAALIVAFLWDGRLGLTLALVLAVLIGGQTPFLGVTASFTIAVGGAAAAFSVRVVRRRTKTWHFVSIVAVAYVAAAVTIGLLRERGLMETGLSMGWGITNAVVASLLAIGFLPLLEAFTRITTDQTLLELSDLNARLLKRLSLEAPGTYAHTIAVANLTEAAANAVDANGLLARVGTYYHDIGKLVKPQYFIENQPRGRNPHDKLKPSMSAAIIRSHVMEGLKLAEQDKLPEAVKRFIPEHHGTQQISFFYNRARELDPDAQLNPADFAYPGPKPQTRETAILMLADTVESAARVLQDPNPVRIREMVDRLVSQKLAEGQLDQSPLTLREIDQIKDSLTNVLTGMYHHRVDYPTASPPAPAPVAKAASEPRPRDAVAAGGS
ncbi:MAG: HDIG domain-containing protein [Gemmatimonas sp.]|nr:HDIG domain-containing protein [Gemmatimonas sp.]